MRAHLLAAVSLAPHKRPDVFDLKPKLACKIAENQINGHFLPVIPHVVVDHDDMPAESEYSRKLVDYAAHFKEVIPYHPGNVCVVQSTQVTLAFKECQNFLERGLSPHDVLNSFE
jgi:hypothetical protein